MSKLQKSAWLNLGLVTVLTLTSMLMIVFMAKNNAKGVDFIIVGFVPACIATPIIYIVLKKKSIERNFDEREKMINQRATTLSLSGLIIFLYFACFIPLLGFGAGNVIKIIYLPIVFWGTLFAYQLIKSMAIIIQCMLEEENG